MEKLASLNNVSIKISGLPMMIHDASVQNYKPYIDTVVSLFGPQRCMIGSNFPVDKVIVPDYDRLINIYRECISELPLEQQKRILSSNALEFYSLSTSAER
jgi:predicted TIM-barrel fold metal-dependent hydrolase